MTESILMAPSILSADFSCLGDAIRTVEAGGADYIHVDVMDGHFVPNLTIGPPVIRSLKAMCTAPLDVHLMIDNADSTIDWYIDAGADSITVHVEACPHLHRTLTRIQESGRKAAVSINPATGVDSLVEVIAMVDMILVMSVNPGFGGQSFIGRSVEKVAEISWMADQLGVAPLIQVDGGITTETVAAVAQAGARCFVAGNAVYAEPDPAAAMNAIRAAAQAAIAGA